MTIRIKANKSSAFRGNMECRQCDTGTDETQEHLELCTGFPHEQRGLKMNGENGKSIFWRRMAPKLKLLTKKDNFKELKQKIKTKKGPKKDHKKPYQTN